MENVKPMTSRQLDPKEAMKAAMSLIDPRTMKINNLLRVVQAIGDDLAREHLTVLALIEKDRPYDQSQRVIDDLRVKYHDALSYVQMEIHPLEKEEVKDFGG